MAFNANSRIRITIFCLTWQFRTEYILVNAWLSTTTLPRILALPGRFLIRLYRLPNSHPLTLMTLEDYRDVFGYTNNPADIGLV